MGYEIKMMVGSICSATEELQKDEGLMYSDGSGHPYKRGKDGQTIPTGRKAFYILSVAEVKLCKLGYQDDPLNRLIKASHTKAKEMKSTEFHYWYSGEKETEEDCYGENLWPVPIMEVLEAIKTSNTENYCRLHWAQALLESIVAYPSYNEVCCYFYGY